MKASLTCCLCGRPAHDPVDLATDQGRGWIEDRMRDGKIRQGKFAGRIMHEKGACKFAPEHGDPAVKANRALFAMIGFEIKDDSGFTAIKEGKASKIPPVEVRRPGPAVIAAVEAAANIAPVARNAAGKPTRVSPASSAASTAPDVVKVEAPVKVEPPIKGNGATVTVDAGMLRAILAKLPREALLEAVLSGSKPTILISVGDREWTLSAAEMGA